VSVWLDDAEMGTEILTLISAYFAACRDLVNASLRNLGKAPGGEYRTPPLVSTDFGKSPSYPRTDDRACAPPYYIARHEQLSDARWAASQASLEIDHEHVPRSFPAYPGRKG